MQIIDMVHHILETGVLPRSLERQIHKFLEGQKFTETEIAAIDQLIEALCSGSVRLVA